MEESLTSKYDVSIAPLSQMSKKELLCARVELANWGALADSSGERCGWRWMEMLTSLKIH